MAGAAQSRASDSTKYVEYEEYVDFQLEKTRGIVKRTDILTTLMALAVGVLAYLLIFVVCDHWVIEGGFGYAARISLLSAVAAIVLGVLAWRVVWPLLRQVNPLYAARVLERSDPQFQSNLVNFVDVRLANAETAPPVLKSMQKRAAVELSHIDVEEAVDHRPLLRIAYTLLGIVVVSALYIFLSPKDVFVSVGRALLPTSPVAAPTETTINYVDPGNKDVPARTRLMVTAEIHGEAADQAQILFTTADRKYVDEPVKMRRETAGLKKFIGELNGENGKGLLQSLTYRIVAGDARSEDYAIRVMQPPSARVDEVQYEFAKYTELPAKTAGGGDIEAWEGTTVTIKATANMKVARAAIVLTDSDDRSAKGVEISMQVIDGTQLTGTWKLEFRTDGTAPHYYHIQVRTENQKPEEFDTDPTQYALRIRPDLKPEVALLDPTGDLTKPANAIIPLVVQATDPDFKIRSLTLRGTRGGDSLFNQDVKLFEDKLPAQTITGSYKFQLERLNLQPGERITFWIEARDNKAPTANRATTTPINVTIEKPVSAEEVKNQLAQDQKFQEEQLERANSEKNPDGTGREQAEPRPGDGRDEPPPRRQDIAAPAASPRTDTEEPRVEENDSGDAQGVKGADDQPRQPADNEQALNRLLQKQQREEQKDQRDSDQTEQQLQAEENPNNQAGKEEGEGGSQTGRGQSKNQQKKGSKPSNQAGESGENSSATGEKPGNQSNTGEDDSQSAGGPAAKTPKKNSKTKPQPKPGSNEGESDSSDRDPANNTQKTKKPGKSDENGDGNDQPQPGGKSDKPAKKAKSDKPTADKPGDQDPDGSGQNADKNEIGNNGKKKADQPQPGKNGAGNEEQGPKPQPGKNPPQPGAGDQDPQEADGAGEKPPKNQADKKKPGKNDTGADGSDQQGKKPGNQDKPGEKAGGTGEDNEAAGGDQNTQQQKEPGKSGRKPGEKSEAGKKNSDGKPPPGGASGESDQEQASDQADQKGPQGDEDGGGGSTGKKPSKGEKGAKKTGATDDPSGAEKPTTDDGSAKNDPTAGDGSDGKPAQEDDPNRQVPRAGKTADKTTDKTTDKKNGARGGSQPEQGDDPRQRKANGNHPKDEGAEGGTDDAENANPAPDGKKPGEKTGKLDEPASEKGVKRRPGEGEKRPDNPTDVGNQKMRGQGSKPGQKSEQPDAGEEGSGAASDQGKPGANKNGPGDNSDEPGDNAEAGKKTGQSGNKKGTGSTTKPSDNGGQKQDAAGDNAGNQDGGQPGQKGKKGQTGKNGKKSDADQAGQGGSEGESGDGKNDSQSGSKPGGKAGKEGNGGKKSGSDAGGDSPAGKGSQPGQPGAGQQRSGGGATSNPGPGKHQSGAGAPPDATPNETNPDDASPSEPVPLTAEEEAAAIENAKKASNLVLKRLKSKLERGEVDQELLDEMGWKGKQDVEKFVRYLEDNLKQDAEDNSPEAEARRMQFEETLRHLGVGGATERRAGSVGKERTIRQTGTKNARPAREYEKIWEAYTRSLSKSGDKTEPKSNPPDQPKSAQPKSTQTKKK